MTISFRLGVIGLGWALLGVAIYALLSRPYPGGADFFPRWYGIRALVLEGRDPYAPEVARDIQVYVLGRPANPDEDQVAFAYPLHLTWPLAAFAILPYAWAQALWQALLVLLLSSTVLQVARDGTPGNHPSGAAGTTAHLFVPLMLWALVLYPAARGLALGQIALFASSATLLGLHWLHRGHEGRAGVALALATVKPQLVLLLAPLLLLWAVRRRRWRLVRWFSGVIVASSIPAFLLVPAWSLEFIQGAINYRRYTSVAYGSESVVVQTLALFGESSGVLAALITIGWLLALLWRWGHEERAPGPASALVIATIGASLLLIPAQGTPAHVLLLGAMVLFLLDMRHHTIVRLALGLALLVVPWAAFFLLQHDLIEHPVQFWLFPLAAFVSGMIPKSGDLCGQNSVKSRILGR